MNFSSVSLRCIRISYNPGVSFSRTWKPFLWNAVIRKDRASMCWSLWEDRILTSWLPVSRCSWANHHYTDPCTPTSWKFSFPCLSLGPPSMPPSLLSPPCFKNTGQGALSGAVDWAAGCWFQLGSWDRSLRSLLKDSHSLPLSQPHLHYLFLKQIHFKKLKEYENCQLCTNRNGLSSFPYWPYLLDKICFHCFN